MTASLDSVTADAMKLSPEDRAELIERLTDPVLPAPPLHPDWNAEIARRVADMDAGLTQFIPADQAMADLHAHILRRQPK